ncbi:MAG: hypothetical protein NVSMB14_07030 [Isosphaeraceae bacterium]
MGSTKSNRNVRTADFKLQYDRLPVRIQRLAVAAYRRFLNDPGHSSLRLHTLDDNNRGRHRKGSRSVSITMQYRAIFVEDEDTNTWYWIGTHAEYDAFTGKK